MINQENPMVERNNCGSQCTIHGNLRARGRNFEGVVIRKFPKRVAITFERIIAVKKYERFAKAKTVLHARLPECLGFIQAGDVVRVAECRPLSKIIHFVVLEKLSGDGKIKIEKYNS